MVRKSQRCDAVLNEAPAVRRASTAVFSFTVSALFQKADAFCWGGRGVRRMEDSVSAEFPNMAVAAAVAVGNV